MPLTRTLYHTLYQGNIGIAKQLNQALRQGHSIVIPPITYYEIRRGFKHKNALAKEKVFSLICKTHQIGKMTTAAWEEVADIYADSRKAEKPIEDTDILIVAFCIVN